jgi:hypothetical protein
MSARQLVSLALLLARIPTNGATATSFGNDYCQDLGNRGVTCTLASSCTPATEVLLPNGATCTLTTGCTITPDVPSPSGVIDESMLDESMHPSSTTDVQQAPPPVDHSLCIRRQWSRAHPRFANVFPQPSKPHVNGFTTSAC